jgi:hypothetical protein
MKRIIGLLIFGGSITFLAIVGLAFGLTSVTYGAQAPTPQPAVAEQPVDEASAIAGQPDLEAQLAQFEASLQERDAAYQKQIADAEGSLQELESFYQAQLQQAQEKLAAPQQEQAQAQAELEAAQAKASQLQQDISAADAAFQSEMETNRETN